jgi:phage/plasmid-associated DNA primase
MDTLSHFLHEACTTGDAAYVKVKAAFLTTAYQAWCKRTGEIPLGNRAFIATLEGLGYTCQRGHANQYYWHGLGLVNAEDESDE